MNKKRLVIVLAFLFLVHGIASYEASAETFSLNPPTKVSLTELQLSLRETYTLLHLAMLIYKMDVIKPSEKPHIKETLAKDDSEGAAKIVFDLENIDLGERYFGEGASTRYYPFSVGDRCFIIKIFMTKGPHSQRSRIKLPIENGRKRLRMDLPVLYEDYIESPAITFQILPGINEMLKGCDIKPINIYPASQEVAKSP